MFRIMFRETFAVLFRILHTVKGWGKGTIFWQSASLRKKHFTKCWLPSRFCKRRDDLFCFYSFFAMFKVHNASTSRQKGSMEEQKMAWCGAGCGFYYYLRCGSNVWMWFATAGKLFPRRAAQNSGPRDTLLGGPWGRFQFLPYSVENSSFH